MILQKRDNWPGRIWQHESIEIMKTKLGVLILLLAATLARAQTNNLTALLQQGLFEEQANRNLDAAILDYQSLATQFDQDRQIAATAVFRLGECYRMQGKTNEAAAQYERVLKDFSDQTTLATLSRQDLTGLGIFAPPMLNELQLKQQLELQRQEALDAGQPVSSLTAAPTDEESQEIQRIQTMIQNSPDLINAPVNGSTPLENAATHGWLKVAAFLLDHGADVNARGGTALFDAVQAGNRAMVEFLLAHGADVNAINNSYKRTPLETAVQNDFEAVMEVLLANKADVNVPDIFGNTPLLTAAANGQVKIAQTLLAAGANPNIETGQGRTLLSFAAGSGSPETVELLLGAKADPNAGTLDAPLLCAIHNKDAASAELLLQAGANPNAKELMSWAISFGNSEYPQGTSVTPLFLAVLNKQFPMVQLLLKFKADPNDSQTDGNPVLFDALGDTNILAALLDAGGKADSRTSYGWPLLDGAVSETNFTAVQMLLQHGANASVRSAPNAETGYTPLHMAALQLADTKIFELLLDNHADPNVRGSDGKTPLDLLKETIGQVSPAGQMVNGISPEDEEKAKLASQLADLLRQHGALDNLPDWNSIKVSRSSANFSMIIFQKSTNDWNHFTLLELLGEMRDGFSSPSSGFPDLAHLVIVRPSQTGAETQKIKVNLLNATNGINCSKDIPLQFGDTVEIPELEHTLAAPEVFLTKDQAATIMDYLKNKAGSAKLIVDGGQTVQLPLEPLDFSQIGNVLQENAAQAVLTSDSDLSRVKVTRRNPSTGRTNEWILDLSNNQSPGNFGSSPSTFQIRLQTIINNASRHNNNYQPSSGLWLRNGDVIEVPEKPQNNL